LNRPKISIVICTHRRFDLLRNAVESLCKQTTPKNDFEIIIVDNDLKHNKEVIDIVNNSVSTINIHYVFEPAMGLSKARNKGGKASLSDYVGYIDDDAIAKNNYIEVLLELININQYDIIGGPYYPFYTQLKPKWFTDNYESFDFGGSRLFKSNEFLTGTNMVYRKTLLEKVNWFDSSYGMAGKKIAYGEETNLQIKLWRNMPDLKVFYCNELFVYHFVPGYKMTLKDKFLRSFYLGRSQARMWSSEDGIIKMQRKAIFLLAKSLLFLIFRSLPSLLFRNREKFPFWQNYAYEEVSKQFLSIGQLTIYVQDYFK
jgi:glycosyltransferase involved in cell wall biosynthesis